MLLNGFGDVTGANPLRSIRPLRSGVTKGPATADKYRQLVAMLSIILLRCQLFCWRIRHAFETTMTSRRRTPTKPTLPPAISPIARISAPTAAATVA